MASDLRAKLDAYVNSLPPSALEPFARALIDDVCELRGACESAQIRMRVIQKHVPIGEEHIVTLHAMADVDDALAASDARLKRVIGRIEREAIISNTSLIGNNSDTQNDDERMKRVRGEE